MKLTNDDVVEILQLLDESPYDELNLATTDFRLKLKRSGSGWVQEAEDAPRDDVAGLAESAAASTTDTSAPSGESGLYDLPPPLPGTFYRAPKPGADPFVQVGDRVDEDTTVGIVETMKLMNSVPAGVSGEIVAIVAENGQMVEPGDVLMQIRPDEDG